MENTITYKLKLVVSGLLTLSILILPALFFVFTVRIQAANTMSLGPVTAKDVIYQIITDRFYDGDKSNNIPAGFKASLFDGTGSNLALYQGGDWQGIIDKIPYLKGMGITAVWLTAPYSNFEGAVGGKWTSYHGYHVRNYFATNKHFGTLNKFKQLRDALHKNGIKLIIDFVSNHASDRSVDGRLYEPDKDEKGNYAFDKQGEPYDYNKDGKTENLLADPRTDKLGWFHNLGDRRSDNSTFGFRHKDLANLADFSQENEQVIKHLEKAMQFWANMGINGIRHDATLHMNPAFVKGLKDSIDSQRTLTHFGEFFISRPDPKYGEYVSFPKRTGVNNLDFEYFRAITSTFGNFRTNMQDFAKMLEYTQKDYPYENQAVTFLDNHDVSRFGYLQRNSKVYNAALATLLTSRGIPNIYYGTEQQVTPNSANDTVGRIFMQKSSKFDSNSVGYRLIAKLAQLRKENDALAYGTTQIRYSDDNVLIFERQFYDNIVLVAVNRHPDESYTIKNIKTDLVAGTYPDYLNSLLAGNKVQVVGQNIASLTLKAGSVSVWQVKATKVKGPQIGDVISTMGRAGNQVHIYGAGLDGKVSVKFDNVVAKVISNSANEIITEVPSKAKVGLNRITVNKNNQTSNDFSYTVLSGDQNQIIFHLKTQVNPGEKIYVAGNVAELGNWQVTDGSEAMLRNEKGEFFLAVSVPVGHKIEFKFVKKDQNGQLVWQEGANHSVQASALSTGTVDTQTYTW